MYQKWYVPELVWNDFKMENKNLKEEEIGEQESEQKANKSEIHATLIEFVKAIQKGIGLEVMDSDWVCQLKQFFGTDETSLVSIKTDFPLYQQAQACYAINKFITTKTKVKRTIDFSGEYFCAPQYKEVEIKRGKTTPLLARTWVFIEWKKVPLLIHISFDGLYSNFRVLGLRKHNKIVYALERG